MHHFLVESFWIWTGFAPWLTLGLSERSSSSSAFGVAMSGCGCQLDWWLIQMWPRNRWNAQTAWRQYHCDQPADREIEKQSLPAALSVLKALGRFLRLGCMKHIIAASDRLGTVLLRSRKIQRKWAMRGLVSLLLKRLKIYIWKVKFSHGVGEVWWKLQGIGSVRVWKGT